MASKISPFPQTNDSAPTDLSSVVKSNENDENFKDNGSLHTRWGKKMHAAKDVLVLSPIEDLSKLTPLDKLKHYINKFSLYEKEETILDKKKGKRSRIRRGILMRIASGTWFFEPTHITCESIYSFASTGDLILLRQRQRFGISGDVSVCPELVLGMGYTLGGSFQSKSRSIDPWNCIGVVIVFPLGKKFLLICGKSGIELRSLEDELLKSSQSNVACAWRQLRPRPNTSGDIILKEAIGKLQRFAGLVRRGDCTWTRFVQGCKASEASLASGLRRLSESSSSPSSSIRKTSFSVGTGGAPEEVLGAHAVIRSALRRAEVASQQLSQEHVVAATGLFLALWRQRKDAKQVAEENVLESGHAQDVMPATADPINVDQLEPAAGTHNEETSSRERPIDHELKSRVPAKDDNGNGTPAINPKEPPPWLSFEDASMALDRIIGAPNSSQPLGGGAGAGVDRVSVGSELLRQAGVTDPSLPVCQVNITHPSDVADILLYPSAAHCLYPFAIL